MIAGGARRTLLTLVVALLAVFPTTAAALPRQDAGPGPVTLTLDALAPRLVTPDGPAELTVTGAVTNSGPVPVRDLAVRVRRGTAAGTDRAVGAALAGTVSPDEGASSSATPLPGPLDPGETAPVSVRVPLASLALPGPGLYPLVVDVTGTPGPAADPTRVAAVRTLLPVTGTPGRPAAAPPAPATVSVLWPITDRPRRLAVPPGSPPLLADDTLAASLAPGGRLSGLVTALARSAPPGSPAAAATCLAVDGDLLETARDMSGGYQVSSPTGPRPGVGAAAAGAWLAALRATAPGRCVLALPYADADLLATSRGNMSDLTTAARTLGARRTAELLGVPPVPDATVPAGGLLDERSLSDLTGGGARAVVVDGATLAGGIPAGGVGRFAGDGATALVLATDPLAARALAPAGPGAAGGSLATQDALAVVTGRALAGPGVTVLAPPPDWAVDTTAAGALLDGIGDLARRGLVTPVDAGTLLARAGSTTPAAPVPPVSLGPGAVTTVSDQPPAVLDEIRRVRDDQRGLLAASRQDRAGTLTPSEYVEPLTGALLRSLSAAGRGDPALQQAAANDVGAQMRTLRSMVRVLQPAGTYSLGSSDAPLLLTVENQLPVAVDVTVALAPTPGVRVSPVPVRPVPAFGSYQFQVALDVQRSGQFTIDATALTPGGETLGPTSRLLLRSTAYGTITVWLTASAALVLVTLATLRVVLRVRAARRDRRSRRRRRPGPPTGEVPTTSLTERDAGASAATGDVTGANAATGEVRAR